MSIEKRIKRIEEAIKTMIAHREWLASDEWAESREGSADLGRHLDEAIDQHDQSIENYRNILSTLRAR